MLAKRHTLMLVALGIAFVSQAGCGSEAEIAAGEEGDAQVDDGVNADGAADGTSDDASMEDAADDEGTSDSMATDSMVVDSSAGDATLGDTAVDSTTAVDSAIGDAQPGDTRLPPPDGPPPDGPRPDGPPPDGPPSDGPGADTADTATADTRVDAPPDTTAADTRADGPPPDGPPPDGPPPDGPRPDGPPPDGTLADGAATDSAPTSSDASNDSFGDATPIVSSCTLQTNTYDTGRKGGTNECAIIVRDTSACAASRVAQGLSGFWLDFSCRVTLTKVGSEVQISTDSLPDYKSNYFTAQSTPLNTYYPSCNEVKDPDLTQNPNYIKAQSVVVGIPLVTTTSGSGQMHAVVGVAMNGVVLYGNRAAPPDDIYNEAKTFDRCGAHPQLQGQYHYHSEPYAITYDDSAFIGVMRDGYPIYGRRDMTGNTATGLDTNGGHTGVTAHSNGASVYHYHLNEQTSTGMVQGQDTGTFGIKAWFIATGSYKGTFSTTCTGC